MKLQSVHSRLIRIAIGVAVVGTLTSACGHKKDPAGIAVNQVVVPTTPMPMPGQARVAGTVRDGAGVPVAGATIKIAETDASTTTDASGAFAVMVPADSTLTFVTTATGYATSFRESIVLADMAMVTGFDLTVLATADVARIDAMGAPDQVANRGLMALRLHSLSAGCTTAGAKVKVWPPLAAKVVYTRASTSAAGGLDEADPTLDAVQAGVHVDAWLAGAIPPGNMYQLTVEQPGCALMTSAPSQGGVQLTGLRHVDVQSFTEADLFLQ